MKIQLGNAAVQVFWNKRIMYRCYYHNGVMLDTPFIREAYLFLKKNSRG